MLRNKLHANIESALLAGKTQIIEVVKIRSRVNTITRLHSRRINIYASSIILNAPANQ